MISDELVRTGDPSWWGQQIFDSVWSSLAVCGVCFSCSGVCGGSSTRLGR